MGAGLRRHDDCRERSQPTTDVIPAKEVVSEAVNALMGSKPEARFRFIQEHAAFAKDLDI